MKLRSSLYHRRSPMSFWRWRACPPSISSVARSEVTNAKTRETELRGTQKDDSFDAVALVDGVGRREIMELMPEMTERLEGHGININSADTAVYDMAYCLEPTG